MSKHYQISLGLPATLEPLSPLPECFHILYIKQINDSEAKATSESKCKIQSSPIIDAEQKNLIVSSEETLNFYLTANNTFIDRYIRDVDDAWALLWSLDGKGNVPEYKTIELHVEKILELRSSYNPKEPANFIELGIRYNIVYLPQMRYRFIIDSKAEIETKDIENKLIEWKTILDEAQLPITQLIQDDILILGEEEIT